jgi:IS30 family transposase
MPYTPYNTDEKNALQAMESMGLPKGYMSAILGKHQSSIYREFNRNGSGGVYTGKRPKRQANKDGWRTNRAPKPTITRL